MPSRGDPPTSRSRDAWIIAGLLFTLILIVTAFAGLWQYKTTAGTSAATRPKWPTTSSLVLSKTHPTLVVFAHPLCACTAATLTELRGVMSEAAGKVDAQVLFMLPDGVGDDWLESATWRDAISIPGVHVQRDERSAEARRFGAATSGQIFLYAPDGYLLYSGGITDARGHVGANPSRALLMSQIDHPDRPARTAPVFGCGLEDPAPRREN